MDVLLVAGMDADERRAWRQCLCDAGPEFQWLDADAEFDPGTIEVAVVANPPPGRLQRLPRLRLIQSMWAGVDRLLSDPTLPPVPVARMVDPAMSASMAETVLWAVLSLHRGFFTYGRQQQSALWRPLPPRSAGEVNVLVLGQGALGRVASERLRAQGYGVRGWHRGQPLQPLLPDSHIVVNLLPLTDATRGLLDARFFAALPAGAAIVNLARGAHVVDADLLEALDRGPLAHAVLDVFHTEPLPQAHPFWRHPQVTVLPHTAAPTDPRSAANVVAQNLRALRDGRPLAHLVDRTRGY